MGALTAGAVVLVKFPFSDLSQAKLRPAVVVAEAGRSDQILCQITCNPYGDGRAITLDDDSFAEGSLRLLSYARPARLFSANGSLVTQKVGSLRFEVFNRLIDSIIELMNQGR